MSEIIKCPVGKEFRVMKHPSLINRVLILQDVTLNPANATVDCVGDQGVPSVMNALESCLYKKTCNGTNCRLATTYPLNLNSKGGLSQ